MSLTQAMTHVIKARHAMTYVTDARYAMTQVFVARHTMTRAMMQDMQTINVSDTSQRYGIHSSI